VGGEAVSTADLLAPPDDATVNRALSEYEGLVRQAYGPRLKGVYLFGSRARGDHAPESDADVAIVLAAGTDWDFWREKTLLTDLTYDLLVETGTDIQAWPVRDSEWNDPDRHRNPDLLRAMRRDARPIGID
jgi:uncharacterized protein